VSVGRSADGDSRRAGYDAALQAITGTDPGLLMVFCSARRDPYEVLNGINDASSGVPVIGCSSSAVIAPDGPSRESVVAVALGGSGLSAATAVARRVTGRQREAGAEIAASATRVPPRQHQVMVLLTDGRTPGQEEVLAGAYGIVGASMPLVGGTSSPDLDTPVRRTFQLYDDEVLSDGVVGVTIASDGPFGVGIRHGWRKVGEPMIVTRCTNGKVLTLDDRPALVSYLDRLGAPPAAYTDPAVFERFSQTRPIGVRRRSGEEVRNVSSVEYFHEGWLWSSGGIPEGGLVWPMEGDEESVVAAAGDACRDAVAALSGVPPLGLLAFDCESRGTLLGPAGMRREVARMVDELAGLPVAGLYTWGEIARVRGINGYHNQTLAVLAVG
jgi:hypothetical protein